MNIIQQFYFVTVDRTSDVQLTDNERRAIQRVMPLILDNELTDVQRYCFKNKYLKHQTQKQTAEELSVTQASVSRHIKRAEQIVNNILNYVYKAVVTIE